MDQPELNSEDPKDVGFLGSSLDDLRAFPIEVRRNCGHQIDRVQNGLEPVDWKPMKSIGPGVREIREYDQDGIYRVVYVAKFPEAVYVLHCFQKKTEATSKADIDLAKARYKNLIKDRK